MNSYDNWFSRITGHPEPHDWQTGLASEPSCSDRLIRVPTGLGKTEGVLGAWAWNRLAQRNGDWPRRLVWCLPMRVLVEQTAETAERFLSTATVKGGVEGPVSVHRLMGGVDVGDWHLHPERPAVLVGTQDMLLSRALNRGYAAGRARWPVDYGLLNHDTLWVMDEVQLMGVGLATSVQLQAFRRAQGNPLRPTHTWWMSATLQPGWLETVDSAEWMPPLREEMVQAEPGPDESPAWQGRKPLEVVQVPADTDTRARGLAAVIERAHRGSREGGRLTLAIVNRVATAQAVYEWLSNELSAGDSALDVRLVHSRFRALERAGWPGEFLSRGHAEEAGTNRIIVATQVVEAGVDISGTALVTELAPWPSLVQRFGRAARYGGKATITVVDRALDGKDALPYEESELQAALEALASLPSAGLEDLERFRTEIEGSAPDVVARLYPYEPLHLLTPRENTELFDTSPDLTGADLDVSRFIRTGEDRDLAVFWAPVDKLPTDPDGNPSADVQPLRDGLCPVPVAAAKSWLFKKASLRESCRAWSWDYVDGEWRRLRFQDCYPGQVLLVDAAWGGYDAERGFTGKTRRKAEPPVPTDGGYVTGSEEVTDNHADSAPGRDDLSQREQWKTIFTHGRECSAEAAQIASELGLDDDVAALLRLAARVHDLGKAHPVFQASIGDSVSGLRPDRGDLAKAPRDSWDPLTKLYQSSEAHGPRRGFRHELATVLGLFELLYIVDRDHPALLGPHRELIELGVLDPGELPPQAGADHPFVQELADLSAQEFDLLCHLISAHHGKVRGAWQSTRHDQEFRAAGASIGSGQPLNGVRTGDLLPPVPIAAAHGEAAPTPALVLRLDPAYLGLSSRYGSSWSERLSRLLRHHGPFALGYLEALLRAADVRASRMATGDPTLPTATVCT